MIAVVLAAGESKRFGRCKQMELIGGVPMLAHVIRNLPSSMDPWVIVGDQREIIEPLANQEGAQCHFNKDYKRGMATSVTSAAQLAFDLQKDMLLTLADLPYVSTEDYGRLLDGFQGEPLFSKFSNQVGPPAIFPNSFLPYIIKNLQKGGVKNLIDRPLTVSIPNAAKDIDTPSDLG